ncbi:MAG: M18 family aminopeptidase [Lachnospiraceae bacterium]
MQKSLESAKGLLDFIEKSPSCFQAVKNTGSMLEQNGFVRLLENKRWELVPGGNYYVTRNASSLIAFRIPEEPFSSFQLMCSHTDSPSFKVKENPEIEADKKYTKLNVEKYGGMLCAPWFDRPLSVAGRVVARKDGSLKQILVNVDRDILMLPNVAIHMNRDANDGMKYNAQTDMCPIFGDETAKGTFVKMIADEAGVLEEELLGMDLFLYNRQKGSIWGSRNEFLSAPRLDDLQCMYASLQGFLAAEEKDKKHICVFCAFDNEETGSISRQGAASTFLQDTLLRINESLGRSQAEYRAALSDSFMISCDNAHAVHPNHPEMADPVNRPQMNHGIVIKYNANQKYTTDAVSGAVFKQLCALAEVPCQVYTNRSDIAGGSTLGNISNTQVSLRCVDIGLAQLAMHSPYETAGVEDTWYLVQLARVFYQTHVKCEADDLIIEAKCCPNEPDKM